LLCLLVYNKDTMIPSFQVIKKTVLPILKRYDVKKAAIFGSYVRGEAKKHSDIDMLVEFGGDKSLLDLIALQLELEKVLKKKVDISTYKSVNRHLRERILNTQKRIL